MSEMNDSFPVRVRLSRKRGWRMPPNTVKVDRTTKWGNPFRVTEDRTEVDCAMAFGTWLRVETAHAGIPERRQWMLDHLHELRGKNLACWCRHGAMCHADVLLEMANSPIRPNDNAHSSRVSAAKEG